MHVLLLKQTNFKTLGQFENLGFVIMSTKKIYALSLELLCSFKYKDVFVVRYEDQLITECCSHPR